MRIQAVLLIAGLSTAGAFAPSRHNFVARSAQQQDASFHSRLHVSVKSDDDAKPKNPLFEWDHAVKSAVFALGLGLATMTSPLPAMASDPNAIVSCLFQKCQLPLAKCIANPKCLANVACIQTCNGKEDEIGCQIKCGDLFENEVIGDFNKCVVSDMNCVAKKPDNGAYPVPATEKLVKNFDTKLWNGKWFISAGQNKLFDIFPCQVHFFTETAPGTFFGKLNWRVEEPDGEYFTRDAIQQFVQDPKNPAHLVNHDNEFLHYEDDWYIVDFEYDDNKDGVPPFAFVYYRGSNDAWDGYGGVFVYTRESKLPDSLIPRMRVAAQKVGFDWDKDFTLTDNSCPTQTDKDKLILRERFAGKVALQTEEQIQAQVTRLRGNAVNSVKAQKLFFAEESPQAEKAFNVLNNAQNKFETDNAKK
jgi:violaxanthin de-epoxidase